MLLSTQPSEGPNPFLPLLVVLSLALLVPIVLARFRSVPIVVGEIVAGIIVGPSVLGLVEETTILRFLADTGLAFLIFLAGMEVDLGRLLPTRNGSPQSGQPNILLLALAVYASTMALALPGGFLLTQHMSDSDPWLLAFVLSATALGVLLPIIKQRNMLSSVFGQLIFLVAILAEFLTVLMLTVYVILQERGPSLQILAIGLLFLAFLILYRIGPNVIRRPSVRAFVEQLSYATVQLKVRGAVTLLIAFVVLAEFVGAELILGAFLAGMIVSLLKTPDDEVMVEKLEAFGFGFFIPVFFIMVGVQIDLRALFAERQTLLLLPVLLVVATLVKLLPMLLARRWLSWRETLAGGILLNTHLSLEVAIAVVGLRAGLLDTASSTSIVLFAVLTILTMPVLFNALMPVVEQRRQRLVVAVGVNDLGLQVGAALRSHGEEVWFLEGNPTRTQRAHDAGFAVFDNPGNVLALDQLPITQVETLLALHDDDQVNYAIAQRARALEMPNVVALVQDPLRLADFTALGVQSFVSAMMPATMIAMMARNPDTYTLLTSTRDQRDISEVRLRNRSLVGTRLRRLQLPGDYLILSIRRRGEIIIPHGNTLLEYGDRLSLLGDPARLAESRALLEGDAPTEPGLS